MTRDTTAYQPPALTDLGDFAQLTLGHHYSGARDNSSLPRFWLV